MSLFSKSSYALGTTQTAEIHLHQLWEHAAMLSKQIATFITQGRKPPSAKVPALGIIVICLLQAAVHPQAVHIQDTYVKGSLVVNMSQ